MICKVKNTIIVYNCYKFYYFKIIYKESLPTIKFYSAKITLNKKTATVLGKSITYPAGFSLSWHAKGGICTQPTLLQGSNGALHGVGDVRGGEAIIPLKELWDHLDGAGTTINVYGNANSTAADIAAEVERRIIAMQKRRRMAW